jgi:hypothetical protein
MSSESDIEKGMSTSSLPSLPPAYDEPNNSQTDSKPLLSTRSISTKPTDQVTKMSNCLKCWYLFSSVIYLVVSLFHIFEIIVGAIEPDKSQCLETSRGFQTYNAAISLGSIGLILWIWLLYHVIRVDFTKETDREQSDRNAFRESALGTLYFMYYCLSVILGWLAYTRLLDSSCSRLLLNTMFAHALIPTIITGFGILFLVGWILKGFIECCY